MTDNDQAHTGRTVSIMAGKRWFRAALAVMRDALSGPGLTMDQAARYAFDSAPKPIALLLADLNGLSDARVSREVALTVPGVQRARNEVCALATLPLRQYRGLDVIDSPLLRQTDPDVANVITWAGIIEDLIFERTAWLLKTGLDFDGYPVSARYIPFGKVSVEPPKGQPPPPPPPPDAGGSWVWIDGERHPISRMIRFDSPNPGVLTCNARSIRTAVLLDKLAAVYAENPRPLDYFTDTDDPNIEPLNDSEIDAFLAKWAAEARSRSTAWMSSKVKRVDVSAPSPAELQLVELKKQAAIEIANALMVDPEDLGVSTTSRTYQNERDRRIAKINEGRRPIMKAITHRLSMGDVTRRGHTVDFDLSEYLDADPLVQAGYWQTLLGMGVTDAAEIRKWAKLPGPPPAAAAAPYTPPGQTNAAVVGNVTASRAAFTFDTPDGFTFGTVDFAAAARPVTADPAKRTITGLAMPYNVISRKYGMGLRFLPGCLEYDANVKHFKDHVTPVGLLTDLDDTAAGPIVQLSVLDALEGSPQKIERDQLLYDAAEGLYNGLSVRLDFELFDPAGNPRDATYNADEDVYDVHRATLREVTSTSLPEFNDARVTAVAASASGGAPMHCPHCGQQHAPNISCATHRANLVAASTAAMSAPTGPPSDPQPAPPGPPQPDPPPPPAPSWADPASWHAWASFAAAQQNGALPTLPQIGQRAAVVNGPQYPVQVSEPEPYRFDRTGRLRRGSHDFSVDLHDGFREGGGGDVAARDRVQSFMTRAFSDGDAAANLAIEAQHGGAFAVTTGNVSALNPNRNRPDLYVDQMTYTYLIWEAVNKGTLEDITPFVIPKFNTAAGLVANHVEGTEPTPGSFTATAQTITPSAVSGKIEYTREAWDQGGNPQASGLIWTQMVRGYYEALEAYAVSSLVAVAASIPDITITALAADAALDQSLADGLIPLNYIRGGNRFGIAYTQIDLYKAMAKAKDTAGRRLYPQLGPQNAVGTVDAGYKAIDAHGIRWLPAWALAATGTVPASSYTFDPERVCGWATAPQRIDITWRVAWVDIGIWGYKAFGVTDFNAVREVVYDPA